MKITEKYDKILTGVISGLLLPVIIAFFIFIFAKGDPGLHEWFRRIEMAGIETHIIYLSVFPNFLIFLLFNHFDMLRALRGVLGITIAWAVVVFLIKLF
ncbi:MAG: hypothetical protein MUF36_00965 [Bacteroidales bacterium]|jgi:hypothetical protein|nr:hypothetical protein [Bacteroidales bacterium]